MRFDYLVPTRIVFGRGTTDELGARAKPLGSRALIVSGASARRSGLLDRAAASLKGQGVDPVPAEPVMPDPTSTQVAAYIALAKTERVDVVVGLGGGSAMDAAKAVAVGIGHADPGELVGRTLCHDAGSLPIVAIPTTAGTGSEVTKGAIITDVRRNLKSGIRGEDLYPRLAIVDPDLIETVPPAVAAETLFDATAHLIESYVCRGTTPIAKIFSEHALDQIREVAAQGAIDLGVPETREALCFAALLGGLNVGSTGSCLPHRVQQAMGSVDGPSVPHGRGLALVYNAWLTAAYPFAKPQFDRLALRLGGEDLVDVVARMLERLSLASNFGQAGFGPQHVDSMLDNLSGNIANDPIEGLDKSLIGEICRRALGDGASP
jgi:alcohol dehydrogenase class IV